MDRIFYAKVAAVVGVAYIVWLLNNIFTYTFPKVRDKVAEVKEFLSEEGSGRPVNLLSWAFYVVLPLFYLYLLLRAELHPVLLAVFAAKLALTAVLSFNVEKRIFSDQDYTVRMHWIGKTDAFLNAAMAGAIVYFLIWPLPQGAF